MKSYSEIVEDLRKPFPTGTVIKNDNRGHIPVQAYMSRLEEVAASQWSWRIVGEPIMQTEQHIVIIKGEITLVDAVRQGIGVANVKKFEAASIKTALMTAESEAFRDACDKFLMGWQDLAPYRDWGKNPGISLLSPVPQQLNNIDNFNPTVHSVMPSSGRTCLRCKKKLGNEEELFLSLNNIKHSYCKEHVPSQLLKNYS